ncbi:Mg-chelatase subunit ChlD [Streptomyces canus]|uniref:caspase family protein n=1 Tax=Streptomyces canus TaxID=58343 RepID=UPI0027874965|nr:caspase family protein [Streptomyces canus]MDQ0600330.1 Mg-chelatase subunit ChlD [Streptomyces canus]
MTRFDPRGRVNRALLVGVSEYEFTDPPHGVPGDLPAVKHDVNRLRDALLRGRVFGEHDVVVSRSPSQDEFNRALHTAAGEAEGLLLLYFAGHGAIPSAGDELFLQMHNARVVPGRHAVFPGAEMFTTVLTVLAGSPAERVVVILDCCFAGNAAWLWERFESKRRVLLLMSVQANHRVDAGDPGTPTPFTGELVQLLDEGGELGFRELSDALRARMAADGYETVRGDPWEPQSRSEPDEDVLLSAPGVKPPPPPPPPPVPPRRPLAALLALLGTWAGTVGARLRRSRLPGLLRAVGPTRLTALLAVAAIGLGSYGIVALTSGSDPCPPPLELRVLTDPDLAPSVTAATDAYLTSDANTTGDGCRRSGITVYSAGSADTVAALGQDSVAWQEPRDEESNPQRDVGPQPDVWIPASPADAARVAALQDTDAVAELKPDDEPFAHSPVVLAVPDRIAAKSLGDRVGLPLSRMIDHLRVRDENAAVRRPDPEFADAALLATIGLYDTANTDAAGAEQKVAQPGPPAPTGADLLCALPEDNAVDDRTAALVPEFLLRSGVACERTTRTPRTAQYPNDVPGVQPTFVRVRWEGGDRDESARDRAAEDFRAWLTGKEGRAVFAGDGFRSTDGELRSPLAAGVLPDPEPLDESAGAGEMTDVLERYRAAHGPGRVLYLLDSSGSMAGLWKGPSGGPGLLKQSLGGLGGKDEYAVWGVSGTSGDRRYETVLAFGPHTRKEAERAVDTRAEVRDAQADPHAALLAALDEMAERGTADDRPQLIVHITDGEDDTALTAGNLDDVLTRARSAKIPVATVSLDSAGCDPTAPAARIAIASGGRCLDAGDDLGAALADEVARTGTGED